MMRELNACESVDCGRTTGKHEAYPPECEEETKLYQLGQGDCEEMQEEMTLQVWEGIHRSKGIPIIC